MKKLLLLLLFFAVSQAEAQQIRGHIPPLRNEEIIARYYPGLDDKEMARTRTDSTGHFVLSCPAGYRGAALLQVNSKTSIHLLLGDKNVSIRWDNPDDIKTLQISDSKENEIFTKANTINDDATQKLLALRFLADRYPPASPQLAWVQNEMKVQERAFDDYLQTQPSNSYAREYLNYRKFMAEVQLTMERYRTPERLEMHEQAFSKINLFNDDIWHSGLLKNIVSTYYILLRNFEEDSVLVKKINAANDSWLKGKVKDGNRKQELAEFCFNFLESKGLTACSEHIAINMLNNTDCQVDEKRTALFESYRRMALGKTAPDIILKDQQKLSAIRAKFKLVVFGASWCPNCNKDYPSLVGKYRRLKEKYNAEVVYVSIDTSKTAFTDYYKEAPFQLLFDGKGWETKAAKEYHVFATPTYYLLDEQLKIVAKPANPELLEEWLSATLSKQ